MKQYDLSFARNFSCCKFICHLSTHSTATIIQCVLKNLLALSFQVSFLEMVRTIDDLRVADLKEELKRRNVPFESKGRKAQLRQVQKSYFNLMFKAALL